MDVVIPLTYYGPSWCAQIMRMFLIVAAPEEDGMLQLDQVWALDAETRSLARQEVRRETTCEDPMQLTLRIRHDTAAAHQRCLQPGAACVCRHGLLRQQEVLWSVATTPCSLCPQPEAVSDEIVAVQHP